MTTAIDSATNLDTDKKNGVQSFEIGMGILRAISGGHRAMMLKDIAAATETA